MSMFDDDSEISYFDTQFINIDPQEKIIVILQGSNIEISVSNVSLHDGYIEALAHRPRHELSDDGKDMVIRLIPEMIRIKLTSIAAIRKEAK